MLIAANAFRDELARGQPCGCPGSDPGLPAATGRRALSSAVRARPWCVGGDLQAQLRRDGVDGPVLVAGEERDGQVGEEEEPGGLLLLLNIRRRVL